MARRGGSSGRSGGHSHRASASRSHSPGRSRHGRGGQRPFRLKLPGVRFRYHGEVQRHPQSGELPFQVQGVQVGLGRHHVRLGVGGLSFKLSRQRISIGLNGVGVSHQFGGGTRFRLGAAGPQGYGGVSFGPGQQTYLYGGSNWLHVGHSVGRRLVRAQGGPFQARFSVRNGQLTVDMDRVAVRDWLATQVRDWALARIGEGVTLGVNQQIHDYHASMAPAEFAGQADPYRWAWIEARNAARAAGANPQQAATQAFFEAQQALRGPGPEELLGEAVNSAGTGRLQAQSWLRHTYQVGQEVAAAGVSPEHAQAARLGAEQAHAAAAEAEAALAEIQETALVLGTPEAETAALAATVHATEARAAASAAAEIAEAILALL